MSAHKAAPCHLFFTFIEGRIHPKHILCFYSCYLPTLGLLNIQELYADLWQLWPWTTHPHVLRLYIINRFIPLVV